MTDTLHAYAPEGVVLDGPRPLPTAWRNISGFNLHPDPASFGWFPVADTGQPAYDPATERLGVTLTFTGTAIQRAWEVIPLTPEELEVRNPVPAQVTSAQARLALFEAGLLDLVEAELATHPYRPIQIWASHALHWERGNPYVQAVALELGLTDAQVDDLFRAAALK